MTLSKVKGSFFAALVQRKVTKRKEVRVPVHYKPTNETFRFWYTMSIISVPEKSYTKFPTERSLSTVNKRIMLHPVT